MGTLRPTHFWKLRLAVGAALAIVVWPALPAGPAHAAIFSVTKTADTADGTCDADCSLREAVIVANATVTADTIRIPAGYYKLTIAGEENVAAQGDLDISSELTLQAMGPVTLDSVGIERAVDVRMSTTATLSGLHITGGSTGFGGGILVSNFATATIIDSTISGNEVTNVGGGIRSVGSVTLIDSIVSGNHSDGFGGGVNSSNLIVRNSTVIGNTADLDGAGIWIQGGTATVANTKVSDNDAARDGGGIGLDVTSTITGAVTVKNSVISGNDAAGDGGGIYNGDEEANSATVVKSIVSGNNSGALGGGIHNDVGDVFVRSSTLGHNSADHGGGIYNGGTTSVTKSTLNGNRALGGSGGGINNVDVATLSNSTASGNSADISGGGIANTGTGSTTVTHSTITANSADADDNGTGNGGGMFVSGATFSIGNSILSGNTDGATTATHPDCSGTIISNDFNIIGLISGCNVELEPGDGIGTIALGPLAFNGGPTETHSLPDDSAAINHGPTSGSGTDQRGVVRPVGAAFDTGAYERVLCSGLLVNVVGTNAKDTLEGTERADGILAQGGNDTVRAGAKSDKVCGGDNNDKLFGEGGSDTLLGQDGNDLLNGGTGNDTCIGGPGTDELDSC